VLVQICVSIARGNGEADRKWRLSGMEESSAFLVMARRERMSAMEALEAEADVERRLALRVE
jgi:hypothetical protein